MSRELLEEVADWFAEEYARLAFSRDRPAGVDLKGDDALRAEGVLGGLADAEASLRTWAATGRPPRHRPVDSLRLPNEAWQKLQDTGLVLGRRGR